MNKGIMDKPKTKEAQKFIANVQREQLQTETLGTIFTMMEIVKTDLAGQPESSELVQLTDRVEKSFSILQIDSLNGVSRRKPHEIANSNENSSWNLE